MLTVTEQRAPEGEGQDTGFSYFMVRIQRPGLARQAALSGVIERLGTGETRSFSSGAQLLELLGSWLDGFKMQVPAGGSNGEERASHRSSPADAHGSP